ncbi:DUF3231 family protein [Paenibacillus sp. LjRoot153]|uniref:DUF3231 family protein n=1 Tax=Paenibacillus sp. LjRoot153 TaxID=3342270 RepID=UPI003ECF178C
MELITEPNIMSKHNVRLTSSEMGILWTQYENDTMATCVLKYFTNKCEDKEILTVIDYALSLYLKHVQTITEIFTHEKHPIPVGFTDDDLNIHAPRLFSDTFMLLYIQNMAVIGMSGAVVGIGVSARSDVSDLFHEVLASVSKLHNIARKVALSKGIYVRPPFISTPEKVDFIKKQSFLFDMFGKNKRPLTAIEITHLFINIQTNVLGKAMMMAFAQVCKSDDVKQYFLEGKRIANKHLKKFSAILTDEDIPAPQGSDSHVMDSTLAPFSDKLMMIHTTGMIAIGIGNYGTAAGTCQRVDLSTTYTRLSTEIALFAEDGANILIRHGWLEEPPQADDRNALANQPK